VDSVQPESVDISKPASEVNDQHNAWTDYKPATQEVKDTPPKHAPKASALAPGSAKLSWAQIAGYVYFFIMYSSPYPSSSKPTHKPAPPPPAAHSQQPPAPASQETEPEPQLTGWEEPTTVQPPSWEPEPSQSSPAVDLPTEEPKPDPPAPSIAPEKSEEPSKPPAPAPEPAVDSTPTKVEPPSQPLAPSLPTPALTSSAAATPSPKLVSRTAGLSSRASARNRTTDQPVVMPSSFGSVEKIGMQFGSLTLNAESLFEPPTYVQLFLVLRFAL
jgi:hypothetical protein